MSSHVPNLHQVVSFDPWTYESAASVGLQQCSIFSLQGTLDHTTFSALDNASNCSLSRLHHETEQEVLGASSIGSSAKDTITLSTDHERSDQVSRSQVSAIPIAEQSCIHLRRQRKSNAESQKMRVERLMRNRKAAQRFREKRRAYIYDLQERLHIEETKRARLKAQVSELRDTVLSTKEMLMTHILCDTGDVKRYLLQDLAPRLNN